VALHGFLVNGFNQRRTNPSLEFCQHHQLLIEIKNDRIKFLSLKKRYKEYHNRPNLVNLLFKKKVDKGRGTVYS